MPYNVFSSTVKTQIQFSWGSVARMAVISFFSLPLFFFFAFLFLPASFTRMRRGQPHSSSPPPPTCLPLSALV